jgi:hypothetical protein
MSYKTEVLTGVNDWNSNGLRFATEQEANEYGKELLSRWTVPKAHRVVPSEDPVNYRFNFKEYKAISLS